ncbi:hypothetical protein ElyMa_000716100 [Elysia marginata]|uniref:Uncharacterized protein n=1 Tax=Elysia marginata TaxID=1093978 RepID=A0AAV4GKN1_9GAST|nr:hypothetical protein ElyMa_000716100 [Elysia marginata]
MRGSRTCGAEAQNLDFPLMSVVKGIGASVRGRKSSRSSRPHDKCIVSSGFYLTYHASPSLSVSSEHWFTICRPTRAVCRLASNRTRISDTDSSSPPLTGSDGQARLFPQTSVWLYT